MILSRCAWHRRYFGYPVVYGVTSWRTLRVAFADDICPACARRWRADVKAGVHFAPLPPLVPAWLPRAGLAAALVSAVVLAAQPVAHDVRSTATTSPEATRARVASAGLVQTIPHAGADVRTPPVGGPPLRRAPQDFVNAVTARVRAFAARAAALETGAAIATTSVSRSRDTEAP